MDILDFKVLENKIQIKFIKQVNRDVFDTNITKIKMIKGAKFDPNAKLWTIPNNPISLEKIEDLFNISLKSNDNQEKLNSYSFCEVFPINETNIPHLYAYDLKISGENSMIIGGKLSYSLRQEFKGHWVWTDFKIISDLLVSKDILLDYIEKLWKIQPEVYKDLLDIILLDNWKPNVKVKAAFMVKGLMSDHEYLLTKILKKDTNIVGNVEIERKCQKREWVVDNKPAVSITVKSELLYRKDINSIIKNISDNDELLGLLVGDRNTSAKGEIIEIIGFMKNHRKRLLNIASNPKTLEIIKNAPDEEIIVKIETRLGNRNTYDYPISALRIILRDQDFNKFNIDGRRVLKVMQIEPQKRSDLILEISNLYRKLEWIMDPYNSKTFSQNFINSEGLDYNSLVVFGDQKPILYKEHNVVRELEKRGLYKIAKNKIQIAVINGIIGKNISSHLNLINKTLKSIQISTEYVGHQDLEEFSHINIQKAVEELGAYQPDIIIAYVPDNFENKSYHLLKTLTLSRDIDSQVVSSSTIDNKYSLGNIILGILGKTGNIPYILAEPVSYADYIVGIDIAHEKKQKLAGTINTTAITRIYINNGELMRYIIYDSPIEGETIPDTVLRLLFPPKEFTNKRIIIHRDGYFRKNEVSTLKNWAVQINATFLLVEVIKSGSPRLYYKKNGVVITPLKGDAFILNPNEAFLVSSLPAFKGGTPKPLRIRSIDSFPINQALHSVLSLTILHYGSLKAPKLPISIHYSDKIAYLALRGVKPKNLEGDRPFWL